MSFAHLYVKVQYPICSYTSKCRPLVLMRHLFRIPMNTYTNLRE